MLQWGKYSASTHRLLLLALIAITAGVVAACMRTSRREKERPSSPGTAAEASDSPTKEPPLADAKLALNAYQLTPADISRQHERIAVTSDFLERLEARRALFYPLCKVGRVEEASEELHSLICDVETELGAD